MSVDVRFEYAEEHDPNDTAWWMPRSVASDCLIGLLDQLAEEELREHGLWAPFVEEFRRLHRWPARRGLRGLLDKIPNWIQMPKGAEFEGPSAPFTPAAASRWAQAWLRRLPDLRGADVDILLYGAGPERAGIAEALEGVIALADKAERDGVLLQMRVV